MRPLVFWLITEEYLDLARVSWESVERAMPETSGMILMDYDFGRRRHTGWFVDSIRCLTQLLNRLVEDQRMLWLDADTYMVEPVPELWEMLDKYDLVAAHAPGRWTAPTVHAVPDCFPELNIGVVGMRNNVRVRKLWQAVYALQTRFPDIIGDNDQAALREALWHDDEIRLGVLPSELNLRFNFGVQLRGRAKILHGKVEPPTAESYQRIAASINQGYVEGYAVPPRCWSPWGAHVLG